MEVLNGQKNMDGNFRPNSGNLTRSDAQQTNKPEKKFHIGGISATVWQNAGTNKQGQPVTFRTVTFERNYKDKEGNWKSTNTLRINDLPKASLVISKAYEYITMMEI